MDFSKWSTRENEDSGPEEREQSHFFSSRNLVEAESNARSGPFLPRTLQLDNTFTFYYRISLHLQQRRQQTKMSHLVALQRNVRDSSIRRHSIFENFGNFAIFWLTDSLTNIYNRAPSYSQPFATKREIVLFHQKGFPLGPIFNIAWKGSRDFFHAQTRKYWY